MTVILFAALPLFAQTPPRGRMNPPSTASNYYANQAESAVRQAMEQFGNDKKVYDRGLETLTHLRAADTALTDPTQPYNAIDKASEEVAAAGSAAYDITVANGIIKVQHELDDAKHSPTTADFGRLRSSLRSNATGPAVRLVARDAARIQDDALAWMRIQELIAAHLRMLAETTSASLRAAQLQ